MFRIHTRFFSLLLPSLKVDPDLRGFSGGFLHDSKAYFVPSHNGRGAGAKFVRVDGRDFTSSNVEVSTRQSYFVSRGPWRAKARFAGDSGAGGSPFSSTLLPCTRVCSSASWCTARGGDLEADSWLLPFGAPNRKAVQHIAFTPQHGGMLPSLSLVVSLVACCLSLTTAFFSCGDRFLTFKRWTRRWEGSSAGLRGRGTATWCPAGPFRCDRPFSPRANRSEEHLGLSCL